MPSTTFLNLPKEKQDKILTAAYHEFARSSVEEASIKNIVTEAEIPRGSFYAYFEDKEDLYHYLLEIYRVQTREMFRVFLDETNHDLFGAYILFHNAVLEQFNHAELGDFLKNAFLYMRSGIYDILPIRNHEIEQENIPTFLEVIRHSVNFEKLNIQSEQDFKYILELLTTITRSNIAKTVGTNISNEESAKIFCDKIEILKRGMEK